MGHYASEMLNDEECELDKRTRYRLVQYGEVGGWSYNWIEIERLTYLLPNCYYEMKVPNAK